MKNNAAAVAAAAVMYPETDEERAPARPLADKSLALPAGRFDANDPEFCASMDNLLLVLILIQSGQAAYRECQLY
jgi:hypothetical protein